MIYTYSGWEFVYFTYSILPVHSRIHKQQHKFSHSTQAYAVCAQAFSHLLHTGRTKREAATLQLWTSGKLRLSVASGLVSHSSGNRLACDGKAVPVRTCVPVRI